ncbi:ectomycorrhiza-regulated small secreted protein [Crassisporium funariophilum]|nr:ectomycorrhiza-regulated small secreted protein [Crassisporium funariophilum]
MGSTIPDFALHPLLCYTQHDIIPGHCSHILWDLREAPESARRVLKLDEPLSPFDLSQPATSPPVLVLHVTCGMFPVEWPIEVRRLQGVTVGDVLHAIHDVVSKQIRRDEWELLCLKQQDRIGVVFDNRCRMSVDREECRARGVLRVDCLLHHTWFAGLSASLVDDCSCILTLRRPKL